MEDAGSIVATLRERGYRLTPQRQAILEEILESHGHISPQKVARRVRSRMPAVNTSTIYRTLSVLEDLGIIQHAHSDRGAEYHRVGEGDHVHLTCSNCGAEDDFSLEEAGALRRLIRQHRGFDPDLRHYAISGLCAKCQRRLRRRR
ncbi:MAG: Fur family transcriptional regulator [Actinomycetota bacterium]